MKSKNIPDDIRAKSVKEAESEIKDIILRLEDEQTDLENSIEQYNRVMQLNYYIQEQFKKKLDRIKKSKLNKNSKISPKNLK